ncbi:MAG: RNA polymerase sigma factor [Planctomycetota bacterium]|jgi:RNA polymerase sigma-70 factor (ECF subfamily)
MSDLEQTVDRASQGDRDALASVLERFLPQLRAFTRLHMGPLAQLESSSDIVQSVCRSVLEGIDKVEYRGEAAFRKWLLVACSNRLRDKQRHWLRDKRDARMASPLDSVGDYVAEMNTASGEHIRQEELLQLETALDRLPDEYRQVVTLSRICGLSHGEIAAEMDRSEGATRMLLHRALARLAVELSTEAP